MINFRFMEILDEARAKKKSIPPEKALLLAELAEGLGLSAESVVVHIAAEQVAVVDLNDGGKNHQ